MLDCERQNSNILCIETAKLSLTTSSTVVSFLFKYLSPPRTKITRIFAIEFCICFGYIVYYICNLSLTEITRTFGLEIGRDFIFFVNDTMLFPPFNYYQPTFHKAFDNA